MRKLILWSSPTHNSIIELSNSNQHPWNLCGCGLTDAKIRGSDKDLPVIILVGFHEFSEYFYIYHLLVSQSIFCHTFSHNVYTCLSTLSAKSESSFHPRDIFDLNCSIFFISPGYESEKSILFVCCAEIISFMFWVKLDPPIKSTITGITLMLFHFSLNCLDLCLQFLQPVIS